MYVYIYKYRHIHNMYIDINCIKHTEPTFSDSAKSTVSFITREQRYMKIVALCVNYSKIQYNEQVILIRNSIKYAFAQNPYLIVQQN